VVSRTRARNRDGFTLIELMIAMAVSTIGLLGLMALQTIAINGNMMSRNFSEALGIAQQRLEIAQRTPYASLSALTPLDPACPTATSYCAGGTTGVSPDPNSTTQAIYARCTTVTDNGDSTTTVLVRVCWSDTRNNSHKVEIAARRSP
jgi:type IV pilus assembly protein PilV